MNRIGACRWLCIAVLSTAGLSCASDDNASGQPATSGSNLDSTAATPPVTEAPVTEPPATEPPATDPPATEPPATDPPATEPPATEPPATDPPAPVGPLTVEELLTLGRPIVLAHAAGEDQFPHSSPFGYGESTLAGVDVLDFDVQLSGDGVLIIQHDDSTGRTANVDVKVADMTYEDLHALDNAYWFTNECVCTDQPAEAYLYRGIRTGEVDPPVGYTADDFAIARFRDVAERFASFPVNIEIKGEGAPAIAAAEQLAIELTELDLLDNAVVASFDDSVVAAFHELAPTVEISPGLAASSAWVLDSVALPEGMRILQLPPQFGDIEVLSAEMMTRTIAAGYVVWVWPNDRSLENADGYRQLLERGMAGLNINFPAIGVEAVAAFANSSPPG